jgi:hypothetical protein
MFGEVETMAERAERENEGFEGGLARTSWYRLVVVANQEGPQGPSCKSFGLVFNQ